MGGILKGCPPINRGWSLLAANAIWGFSDPTHAIWQVAEAFPFAVKPRIVGVAGASCSAVILLSPVPVKRGRALHLPTKHLGTFEPLQANW